MPMVWTACTSGKAPSVQQDLRTDVSNCPHVVELQNDLVSVLHVSEHVSLHTLEIIV